MPAAAFTSNLLLSTVSLHGSMQFLFKTIFFISFFLVESFLSTYSKPSIFIVAFVIDLDFTVHL